jgi:ketosteroid isomerase-like protein
MSTTLSQPIAAYIQAANAHDTYALLGTLTTDAVVTDEGREYRGHEEIKEWSHRSIQEYQATLDVTEVTQTRDETVVTAQVAGTFDGSPLPLRFHFTISGDKIAALTIRG